MRVDHCGPDVRMSEQHLDRANIGDQKDVPRAKRSSYVPVVLARDEGFIVIRHEVNAYFIFRSEVKKARTIPIPQSIMQELLAQIERIKRSCAT